MAQNTLALCIQPQIFLTHLIHWQWQWRKQKWWEEHIWVHISFWYRCCFMGFKETTHSNYVFSRRKVCCSYKRCMSSCLDVESVKRLVTEPSKTNNHLLRQQFSHSIIKESHVSQENQSHRHKDSFHKRVGEEQEICLEFCRFENQLADIFTKPLVKNTFQYLRSYLGMTSSA